MLSFIIKFKSKIFTLFFLSIFCNSSQLWAGCVYSSTIDAIEVEIGNMISWTTATETDNAHFLVQRSIDGLEFTTVGEIKGAGTTTEPQRYRFLDIQTGDIRVLYRLRQVDTDGIFTQTQTVIVNRVTPNNFVVTAMSSTLTDRFFSVTLRSEIEETAIFTVRNKKNKIVKRGELEIVNGGNMLSVDLEGLKNGTYLFVLEANQEMEQLRIKKVDTKDVPRLDYVVRE